MIEPVTTLASTLLTARAATDEELVDRAAASTSDEEAFSVLYERHARYVAGVVYRILGSDSDVDDVLQETFLDARAGIGALADARALRGWLVTIAVRRVHRLLRRRRRRSILFFGLADAAPRFSDPRDRQPADDLYEALEQLPPDLRVPWTLSRVEELTLPEVAATCEISLATVKRRIADADERIARRLK